MLAWLEYCQIQSNGDVGFEKAVVTNLCSVGDAVSKASVGSTSSSFSNSFSKKSAKSESELACDCSDGIGQLFRLSNESTLIIGITSMKAIARA